ncbi:MAG: hypothetical protein JWM74_3386 [Myxococcaceae bacterium]|nr:hypothetical protein [Myxococcaceae bacterium]
MIVRPDVSLLLRPGHVLPGETFTAIVVLKARTRMSIDGISLHVEGHEHSTLSEAIARHDIVDEHRQLGPMVLERGEQRVSAELTVPASAPPSYRGNTSRVDYEIGVHVQMSWGRGKRASFALPVRHPPRDLPSPDPTTYSSSGAAQRELYIEASLDSTWVRAGQLLAGAFALFNMRTAVREVEISLVAVERAGSREVTSRAYAQRVAIGTGVEGEPTPLAFRVPNDVPPSFRTTLFELCWHLQIETVPVFGKALTLRIPVHVGPADAKDKTAPEPNKVRRVPPVGRERRAIIWAAVAEESGLENDVDSERMSVHVGPVRVTFLLQQVGDGANDTVGTLIWPALGMDLDVTSRDGSWVPNGRHRGQVASLMTPDIQQALQRFEDVRVDDRGAYMRAPGVTHSIDLLRSFVSSVLSVAHLFAAKMDNLPMPPQVAPHRGNWTAFAERISGKLEPGRPWIHDGVYGMDRIELGIGWDHAKKPRTILRAILDPPLTKQIDRALDGAEVGARVLELMSELESRGQSLRVGPEAIVLEKPGVLAEPNDADPDFELMSRLARVLRGDLGHGPFR